jgi:predicted CXXCH cytochrome family protein
VNAPFYSTPILIAALLAWTIPATGEPVCAGCHPRETARYAESPMGRSLGTPSPVAPGRVVHARSGGVVTIQAEPGKMVHRLAEHGFPAGYDIAFQIGAGNLAHSYIVNVRGYLFESPVTWFRSAGWDLSPGYAPAPTIDFDRPITATCLFCHAADVPFADSDGRRPARSDLGAITCERCHGPADLHVRQPRAGNIMNPRKLPVRARDSVCEQCHLEGDIRILNPGRRWRDFHPGDELERTMVVYVLEEQGQTARAVSQVEQLAQSRCAARSEGKLWCGTCHDPHGQPRDRNLAIRTICQSCHRTVSKATHARNPAECVSCHMPRRATEYAHVAVTDHRIVRHAGEISSPAGGTPKSLAAWVQPPTAIRRRDLALADLRAGVRLHMPELVQAGLKLMSDQQADSDLLAAACDAAHEVAVCRLAVRGEPGSAERTMALGVALASAGQLDEAETELRRAIDLDPSLKHAYLELWTVYERRHKTSEMKATAERFLAWNPSNVVFRLLLQNLFKTQQP